jgi:hypothetical protein
LTKFGTTAVLTKDIKAKLIPLDQKTIEAHIKQLIDHGLAAKAPGHRQGAGLTPAGIEYAACLTSAAGRDFLR